MLNVSRTCICIQCDYGQYIRFASFPFIPEFCYIETEVLRLLYARIGNKYETVRWRGYGTSNLHFLEFSHVDLNVKTFNLFDEFCIIRTWDKLTVFLKIEEREEKARETEGMRNSSSSSVIVTAIDNQSDKRRQR
ncbi:hypothetical protein QLX08_010673 [Tetragonisca angustula]|uniref:Uncharacterized protein n=1 Tax=Tetragonisca angustula TaxID=166442 RepID=A0AAW0ZBG4_9HYME